MLITGEIPSFLGTSIDGIVELDLQRTGITGTIPSELDQLKSLEKLFVHGTDVEGEMPVGLCAMIAPDGGQLRELTANCQETEGTVRVQCNCCTGCFW